MSFFAYMLQCRDGSYYVGQTDNLEARLYHHQSVLVPGYTHNKRPVQLVWHEAFATRDEALQAEHRVKGWSRVKKQALIRGDWDEIVRFAATRGPVAAATRSSSLCNDSAARPSRTSG